MENNKRMKELEKQIAPLKNELMELREKQLLTDNQKYLGRFFKYSNSYGGDERWWLFAKVIEAEPYGLYAFEFQETSLKEIDIKTKTHWSVSGWLEISEEEFNKEWTKLIDRIEVVSDQAFGLVSKR